MRCIEIIISHSKWQPICFAGSFLVLTYKKERGPRNEIDWQSERSLDVIIANWFTSYPGRMDWTPTNVMLQRLEVR